MIQKCPNFIMNIWFPQLALKYIEESESAFKIFWSETNEPKENET